MSTSLNETVFEVQRALEENYAAKANANNPFKDPSLILFGIRKAWCALFCKYGYIALWGVRERHARRRLPNVFTPTDKVFPDVKIAVFTAITSGYDNSLPNPIYVDDSIDYYVFTDSDALISKGNNVVWKVLKVPSALDNLDNARKNRYLKINHDYAMSLTGKHYDYCIYVDGNCRITCDIKPLVYSLIESGKTVAIHDHSGATSPYDEAPSTWLGRGLSYKPIKEQMNFYKSEGLPKYVYCTENPVLIRKCNDPKLKDIMYQWWLQVERFTHRDQLSFPYVLWKNGLDSSYVFSLGNNVWKNPYFIFTMHKKEEQRRLPQI